MYKTVYWPNAIANQKRSKLNVLNELGLFRQCWYITSSFKILSH